MIELEIRGVVRVLHLGDGDNRFDGATVDAIHAVLDELASVEGPVALVTAGHGKIWSNGLDLEWLAANGVGADRFLASVHHLLLRMVELDVWTVAALNGHAFAAGAMFAAAHDHRVMHDARGYWCVPEIDLGLPLTEPMYAVLEARLPRAALVEAVLTGRRYAGPDAQAAGIVDEVAPADAVLDRAIAVAEAGAGRDRSVLGTHKRLLSRDALARYGSPASPSGASVPSGPSGPS